MAIEFPAKVELKIGDKHERFELDFNICENPDCECNGVNMALYNENKEVGFFLDFATQSYRENNYSEEEAEIINALIAFLKSNDGSLNIGFFKRNYEYVKYKVKEKQKALASFKIGEFVPYNEVLWSDEEMKIIVNDKKYLIKDTYCVMPNCNCKTVGLNFYEDIIRTIRIIKPDFSFVYDYTTGTFRDAVGIDDGEVGDIIQSFSDGIHEKFKKRHTKLKKEVKKGVLRKIEKEGFILKEKGKRKLGRNEPCHCGSGKKYKKCCLNKDIEKYGRAIKVSY